MPSGTLLDQLDRAKNDFEPGADKLTARLLKRLARTNLTEPDELVRFHESLLFVVAYPQSATVRALAESILKSFANRVAKLRELEVDLSSIETPEVSGIAGTFVSDTFSYPIVRWLTTRFPRQVEFDWEWFESENRIAESWPRFMPLLEEDASVEANVPYGDWLRTAKPRRASEVGWLTQRFESLSRTETEKAELYDSQNLYVQWTPTYSSTRTGMRKPARNIFYHRGPLIRRKDVSLRNELKSPRPRFIRLPRREGEKVLDLARAASTIRYRELYGFTHGDPAKVLKVDIGRGVELFVSGLPPDQRLPLRAYHAMMIFKNGVPVGYFEGLSLFERMESGFNLYYTFRDGETAWLYAKILHVFRHLLGVTAFAIDPYQIGFENEEGIESGAFWFYRKLGFRPTDPAAAELTAKEEKKLGTRKNYRTSVATLRKLATSAMIFELDQSKNGGWDRFQVRNIGMAVQHRMATAFDGEAEKMRAYSRHRIARELGTNIRAHKAFDDFAVTLSLIAGLGHWSTADKQSVVKIIQAKASSDEAQYLKLMQRHSKLRAAMIRLGSKD